MALVPKSAEGLIANSAYYGAQISYAPLAEAK